MAIAVVKQMAGPGFFGRRAAAPVRTTRRKSVFLPALLGIGLVALALAHVWLRLQVVHLGYVLSTTTKLQGQLEQENRELKVELATLTSPQRLEAMARSRLGMIEPAHAQVVILK